MIKTIMFDFGDTLAYERRPEYLTYYRVFKEVGYETELTRFKKAYYEAKEWWGIEKKNGKIWTERSRAMFLERIFYCLDIPINQDIIEKMREMFPHLSAMRAYKDAEPTLIELQRRGFKLSICSNVSSDKNLLIYLKSANLDKYFDLLIASGTVGYEKPNPMIFKIASKLLQTPPEEMAHIGDRYDYDYQGAKVVGIFPILIDRKGVYKNINCTKVKSLTELLNIL
ncbi:MAG: HAD-IA family hydrolase [Nitrososphaeria archaeon]